MTRSGTGLDTNVLVRFVMADHPLQFATAQSLMQSFSPESPGYISLVCLAELTWVLHSTYKQPKSAIAKWLSIFLDSPEIVIENLEVAAQALKSYESGNAQFADCLIERSCHLAGCGSTVTFDRNAARSAGMRLLS